MIRRSFIILHSDTCKLPGELYDELKVYEMGAKKHGADSWEEPGVLPLDKNMLSTMRHLLAFYISQKGADDAYHLLHELEEQMKAGKIEKEACDKESGLCHLLHARWRTGTGYTLWRREQRRKEFKDKFIDAINDGKFDNV